LFATIIPTLCSITIALCVWAIWLRNTKAHHDILSIFSANGPDSGGAGGIAILGLAFGGAVVVTFVVLPTLICSFCTALIPWKKWYTALAWGLIAQTSGIVIVICLYALTEML